MLIILLLAPLISGVKIIESPEDVTVLRGDPATLTCRMSDDDLVTWYKDGIRIRLETKKNVVQLPDGSLFFLTTRNTDTGLYHCGDIEERVVSPPAALIVGTEEEGIIPTVIEEEEDANDQHISDITIDIQDIPADTVSEDQEVLPMEVMKEEELSSTIYVIAMVVVAILTIIIILGAALIFTKIKRVNNNLDTSQDRESTTPMMYSAPITLERGVNAGHVMPPHYNHYQYILQNEYDTPINVIQSDIYKCVANSLEKTSSTSRKTSSTSKKSSPTNSFHYASSNIIHQNKSQPSTQYRVISTDLRSPKNNYNYFSC